MNKTLIEKAKSVVQYPHGSIVFVIPYIFNPQNVRFRFRSL